jgi:hypothetical protein
LGAPAASAGAAGGLDPSAANLQALLQELRTPAPPAAAAAAAPDGPLNVESVYRQLSLLYAWYASSRAAYLEQVRSDGLALGWGVLPSRLAWPVVLL